MANIEPIEQGMNNLSRMYIGTNKQRTNLKGILLGGRGANMILARPEDYSERDKGG